jgi:hypothetical protein
MIEVWRDWWLTCVSLTNATARHSITSLAHVNQATAKLFAAYDNVAAQHADARRGTRHRAFVPLAAGKPRLSILGWSVGAITLCVQFDFGQVPKFNGSAIRPPGFLPKKMRVISYLLFRCHINPSPSVTLSGLGLCTVKRAGLVR